MVPNFRLQTTLNHFGAMLGLAVAALFYTGGEIVGVPGLAAAPHHEPLIVHCLLTALLLLVGAAQLGRPGEPDLTALTVRIVSWVLYPVFAFVNLLLAVRAAIVLGMDTAAPYVFAFSGMLLGWMILSLMARGTRGGPSADGPETDKNMSIDSRIDAGRSPGGPMATLGMYVGFGLAYAFGYGVILLIVARAASYHRMLDDALLQGSFSGWSSLGGPLPAWLAEDLGEYLALLALMVVLGAGLGIFEAIRHWLDPHS